MLYCEKISWQCLLFVLYLIMKTFKWNSEKNEILALNRGITFDEIVQRIQSGAKVIETDHPNKEKYPDQKIMFRC